MTYSILELGIFFFLYSFIGWCGEVCVAALKQRKFINRGFVNGCICPIYGVGAVLIAVFLPELTEHLFLLFLAGTIISSVLEYLTGKLLNRLFHRKLWDYSDQHFHLEGYICLKYSLLWGVLSVAAMMVINPLLCRLMAWVPYLVKVIVLLALSIITVLDFITTAMTVWGMQIKAMYLADVPRRMKFTARWLENALTRNVQKRMQKSFPSIDMDTIAKDLRERWERLQREGGRFAEGCGFYKLVSLFFIGAFLGDVTETIYCFLTTGIWMSRSSVIYGPFSIVWGIGCALLTALLYRYKDKSDGYIFLSGTLLGGAYEYICSVFTELAFGTVFWDYSGFTFNLGGRINLLYCFFWGIAAVVWVKWIYPFLSRQLERLPKKPAEMVCNVMIVFMLCNMVISSLALNRYTERNTQAVAVGTGTSAVQDSAFPDWFREILDERFTDERMERIYPNAKIVE